MDKIEWIKKNCKFAQGRDSYSIQREQEEQWREQQMAPFGTRIDDDPESPEGDSWLIDGGKYKLLKDQDPQDGSPAWSLMEFDGTEWGITDQDYELADLMSRIDSLGNETNATGLPSQGMQPAPAQPPSPQERLYDLHGMGAKMSPEQAAEYKTLSDQHRQQTGRLPGYMASGRSRAKVASYGDFGPQDVDSRDVQRIMDLAASTGVQVAEEDVRYVILKQLNDDPDELGWIAPEDILDQAVNLQRDRARTPSPSIWQQPQPMPQAPIPPSHGPDGFVGAASWVRRHCKFAQFPPNPQVPIDPMIRALADEAWDYFSREEQYQQDLSESRGQRYPQEMHQESALLADAEKRGDVAALTAIRDKYKMIDEQSRSNPGMPGIQ